MKTRWKRPFVSSGSTFLGLEITDSYMKLAEMRVTKQKAQLIRHVMEKLPASVVEEGRILDIPKLMLLLQSVVAASEISTQHVHLILPSQLVMVRYLKLPDLPESELRKVLDFEVKHNIHLPFEQPMYDFIKLNGTAQKKKKRLEKNAASVETVLAKQEAAVSMESPADKDPFADFAGDQIPDNAAPECDVLLVAAPANAVEEYVELARSAGLKPLSMEIKAFSLFRSADKAGLLPETGTYLLVDVNEKASDLTIFQDRQLKITRSVPVTIPGNTQSKVGEVLFQYAEPNDSLQTALSELGHELERLMNFYRYSLNNRNQVFEELVLSGDVERIAEVANYLAERLNVKIVHFQTNRIDGLPQDSRLFSSLAVPIGLALRGKQR